MRRREFVEKASLLGGLAILGTDLISGCKKKEDSSKVPAAFSGSFTLDLSSASNAALQSKGGSVNSNNVIVINTGGSYTALSAICTHQGCTVGYSKGNNRMECPCHGGVYDLSGNVSAGPPPSGLKKYGTSVSGNSLTVSS